MVCVAVRAQLVVHLDTFSHNSDGIVIRMRYTRVVSDIMCN